MADSDPISDVTPNKRKMNDTRAWDSQEDSGEELTAQDFETAATLPMPPMKRKKLEYTAQQLHADLNPSSSSMAGRASSPQTYVTQPTQTLRHTTQPTQPWNQNAHRSTQPTQPLSATPHRATPDVLVGRSSPATHSSPSPKKPLPEPIRKATFARPGGLLASAMAPPGTAFRRPLGVQQKPAPTPIDSESDDDILDDTPVHHSSDEETQPGLNLKPTNFRKGGRGLNSSPNRDKNVIQESPQQRTQQPVRQSNPASIGAFSSLLNEFRHNDMASAYGSSTRPPRPAQQQQPSYRAPKVNAEPYKTLDDVKDYGLRKKVEEIQKVLSFESVQRCMDALAKHKAHVEDATNWLMQDEEQDAPGEDDDADQLGSTTPLPQRGVARGAQPSQPVRPVAKQEIKASSRTIAERYGGASQAPRRPTLADEEPELELELAKPRRRLQQGRKRRSPSPASSPPISHKLPQPLQRLPRQAVVISDDDDSDSGIVEDGPEAVESSHDQRLLKFFNECSLQNLADTSAQPEAIAELVVSKRPFKSLEQVRAVTAVAAETKSGKKSKARPVGDKIVDTCSEVWTSYDAIDELVKECEGIAKPIQTALKGWGIGANEGGELELTNLDSAHDSGVGTPASSCPSDDAISRSTKEKRKGRFLVQPPNMNSEFVLKDYQLVCLNWLDLLWSKRISCILADDMGLGKTCQIIAFLAHLQQTNVEGCALVIVPGSTLENWLREFARFAPSLKVQVYYGPQNEREELRLLIEDTWDTIDVVVTTYDTADNKVDNAFLRKTVNPTICIFDEAHALRNPKTKRYNMLTRFRPEFRVLLTGTPLQNNLQELIAILAFIMPNMFTEKREELDYIFQHKATTKDPTENAALLSTQRIAKARSIVTPFILRRKKHQVLDLPAKHSRVEYCEMTPSQASYYAELYDSAQQFYANKAIANVKGSAKQSSNILMDLRKAALHPLLAKRIYDDKKIDKITDLCLRHEYLVGRKDQARDFLTGKSPASLEGGDYGLHHYCNDPERPFLNKFALKKKQWMDSGKVAEFSKLVKGFAKKGDRVLVFSQFTMLIDVLEAVLETIAVKFMRLDGSTKMVERQDMIDQFTNDESITVFMLSTRAGGAGINLAAANKVIIFDSGFNPQDDIQAENRAHRVGQTREVEVIRLVTRGTIEEQIHALGESKLALDARVAGDGTEDIKADKVGEQMVEKMFLDGLKTEEQEEVEESKESADLKDAFKVGLEAAGVKVTSKQAQF